MEWKIFCMIGLYLVAVGVNSEIQFQPDTTHCNGEPVEYQCSIDTDVLTWMVLMNNGTQFGPNVVYVRNVLTDTGTIEDVFIPERLSAVTVSPVVSNISFTAQSNINGYTIVCEDSVSLNNINVTITVITPNSPGSVLVDTNSFTSSSVAISWTESSSVCNTIFTYNVNSTNDVSTGTSTSAVLEGLVPSDDNYCVTVTATDYTTRTSEQSCFRFNDPPAVNNLIVTNTTESNTTVSIIVNWEHGIFDVQPGVKVPDLLEYIVSIENSADSINDMVEEMLSPDTTQQIFTGVLHNATYTVSVIAVNGVGSSVAATTIDVPEILNFMTPSLSPSPSDITMSSSSGTSPNTPPPDTNSGSIVSSTPPTTPTGDGSGLPSYVPAVATVGVVVIIIAVVVIVITLIICLK